MPIAERMDAIETKRKREIIKYLTNSHRELFNGFEQFETARSGRLFSPSGFFFVFRIDATVETSEELVWERHLNNFLFDLTICSNSSDAIYHSASNGVPSTCQSEYLSAEINMLRRNKMCIDQMLWDGATLDDDKIIASRLAFNSCRWNIISICHLVAFGIHGVRRWIRATIFSLLLSTRSIRLGNLWLARLGLPRTSAFAPASIGFYLRMNLRHIQLYKPLPS